MLRIFKKYKLTFDVGIVIVALMAWVAEWYDFFTAGEKWRWMFGAFYAIMTIAKVFDVVEDLRKRKNLQSRSNGIYEAGGNEVILITDNSLLIYIFAKFQKNYWP